MAEAIEGLELYKKHRPKSWDDLIGQQKVAQSLRATVKQGRLPTAYIFSGPRGCGKTSAALLLAKSLNCEKPTAKGDPCNACAPCRGIDANSQLGFTYMSMANAKGVETVRDLVKDARLSQPVKRQVFILDEVHNLSRQAFDALLIPLEESTMPALFILCTTEIQKVPTTVLSRMQQRKFSLVDSDTMVRYLEGIVQEDALEATPEQLETAVRLGRGSVRDTLTFLESVLLTGEEASSHSRKLFESLSHRDLPLALTTVAEAAVDAVNFRDFGEQTFEDLRDIMLAAVGVDQALVNIPPVGDVSLLGKRLYGVNGIGLLMKEFGEALTHMSMGADQRILFEVALVNGILTLKKMDAQRAKRLQEAK